MEVEAVAQELATAVHGENWTRLLAILAEVDDLRRAAAVLSWDQQTYMPPGGAQARADQLATLERLAHQRLSQPEVGELLERLAEETTALDPESPPARLLAVARREYQRATKVPPALVEELARVSSLALNVWAEAKAEADFSRFRPHLERLVALQVEKADALGHGGQRYDALLDLFEPGLPTAEVERLFGRLKEGLIPLVQAISQQLDRVSDAVLRQPYPEDQQWAFTLEVLEAMGFDWRRGRQDRSAHPFTTSFAPDDVRITTRFQPNYLGSGLFASIHEGGHALYEQGVPRAWRRTPLAEGASLGIHESQSRLWENVVGRSRPFWQHFFPRLQRRFPDQLGRVDLETFYRAINRVEPSPIRVEADEVTYNLHIFLRFELEQELVAGRLAVADLPEAWNERMQAYLGIRPAHDGEGVLQDVHWASGLFGYFPTYTLGNVLSVQFYQQALEEHPGLPEEIASGQLGGLLAWLRERIHQYGACYEPAELVRRVTGRALDPEPYLSYIRAKYGEIYDL